MAMEKPWLSGATQVHLRLIHPRGFVARTPVASKPLGANTKPHYCSIDATKESIRGGFRTQVLRKVLVMGLHWIHEKTE